ncbi:MAG: alpha/beta hydrolase [Pseudomonadota bacterium]
MPYLDTDTHRFRYLDEGSGAPVILLHSSGASASQWRALIEGYANRYRFLAPDLVGYGGTEPLIDQPYSPRQEVSIVERLVDYVDQPTHLIGHSFGGAVALDTGLALGGRVNSITAIEPVLFELLRRPREQQAWQEIEAVAETHVRLVEAGEISAAADRFMTYWIGAVAWEATPEKLRAYIIGTMGKIADEWRGFLGRPDDGEEFATIAARVHLIRATDTTLAAGRVTEVLRGYMANARYSIIEGAGHLSPITHPQLVNPVIIEGLG